MATEKENHKEQKTITERKYLNVLLKNHSLVEDHLESGIQLSHLDEEHRPFLKALIYAHEKGFHLTESTLKEFIKNITSVKLEIIAQLHLYDEIASDYVDRDDFLPLKTKILENFVKEKSIDYLMDFEKDAKKSNVIVAAKKLVDSLGNLVAETSEAKKIIYSSVEGLKDEFSISFNKKLDNADEEEKNIIKAGIKEVDHILKAGFSPGSMTLFCADVGSYKSTMMMNIALNIWKTQGKNVLYAPLEMPNQLVLCKLLARETNTNWEHLFRPSTIGLGLSDEERKKAKEEVRSKVQLELDSWDKIEKGKLFILDSLSERTKVSVIQREIEKHLEIFKPDVVIVDYIGNLSPDKGRDGRNDLEIGDMLSHLRHMGHYMNFGVISGAQVGREALKRHRKTSGDKVQFYSEDLRGSHEYSSEADTIFVQMKDETMPNQRLVLVCLKSRWGPTTFPGGETQTTLCVKPEIGLITSAKPMFAGANSKNILSNVDENVTEDLSFDDDDVKEEKPILSEIKVKEEKVEPKQEAKKSKKDYDDFDAKLMKSL